jgi:hypothetical protein
MSLKTTLVSKENLNAFVSQVMAGQTLHVSDVGPNGYNRTFQHTDWVDFVDPVQAGGNNGFNERFHSLENEFDLISAVIGSVSNAIDSAKDAIASVNNKVETLKATPPDIGIAITGYIASTAIPIPNGFSLNETRFFAFPMMWWVDLAAAAGARVGFSLDGTGWNPAGDLKNHQPMVGPTGAQAIALCAIAISRRGGW